MKQIYLLLGFLLCSTQFLNAQIVNIPDANFKNTLVNTACVDTTLDGFGDSDADTNDDGEIQVSEAEVILSLEIMERDISSLEGIDAFSSLRVLKCEGNNLVNLDVSSLSDLVELSCSSNELVALNVAGLSNLERLICSDNHLTNLDLSSLSNLERLYYGRNSLSNLDLNGLTNLTVLSCGENGLTELEISGLTNLITLGCENNNLSSVVLNGLTNLCHIDISGNQLTSLDISVLPNLLSLECNSNLLTTLDFSETPYIEYLECKNNLFTELNLNELPNINRLFCRNNLSLTNLYIKNGSDLRFYLETDIQYNTNLEYICVNDSDLELFAEMVADNTDCVVNTYCTFVPGGEYFTIEGQTKVDLNNDGCDAADSILPNLLFNITNGSLNGQFIANATGDYFIPVQQGMHTITPEVENPSYWMVTPASFVANFPTDASPFVQNICVVPNGTHNDLEIVILPIEAARPGFDTDYKIVYKNKGTTTLSGSVNLSFQDELMDFVTANPNTDTQTVNEMTWNFSNLLPFDDREILLTINLNTPSETPPLNGDDVLTFTATINPISGDETPDDNVLVLNQTVVNSFDPNDKTCLEGATITANQVGKYVHYMVRFENTGTASAVNIVVKDEIDTSKYDISTLIPLKGSHEFVTRIKDNRDVEFIFENINLPFDDANNDGYVLFKIKTLPTLQIGDTFSNDAEIYFDYNAPIITNDETTVVAENLSNQEYGLQDEVTVYPNPANDDLFIESKSPLNSITIYDMNGRLLEKIVFTGNDMTSKIDLTNLLSAIYFLKIETNKGVVNKRIIKN